MYLIKSNNGTNFVDAINELWKVFQKRDHNQISQYLQTHEADWTTWIRNSPTVSHMGGVCERQIRKARSILNALLKTHGISLNDEALHTMVIGVEAIVNSRPVRTETINDVQVHVPLFPSSLLTMKSKVFVPPPGSFGSADTYCRRRWKRTQHIVNEFWARWCKEFI